MFQLTANHCWTGAKNTQRMRMIEKDLTQTNCHWHNLLQTEEGTFYKKVKWQFQIFLSSTFNFCVDPLLSSVPIQAMNCFFFLKRQSIIRLRTCIGKLDFISVSNVSVLYNTMTTKLNHLWLLLLLKYSMVGSAEC